MFTSDIAVDITVKHVHWNGKKTKKQRRMADKQTDWSKRMIERENKGE